MNKLWVYFALILVQVLFGFNFVASKFIVGEVSPVYWAVLRFIVCGLGLLAFVSVCFYGQSSFRWSYFGKIAIFSFFAFTVGQIAFLKGLKLTTTSNSAIICSTIPIFTLVIVVIMGQEKLTLPKLIGFVLAFAGVICLRKIEDFSLSNQTFVGDLLILLCAFSTGLFIATSKKFLQENSYWWVSTWMYLMGGVQISLFAFYEGDFTFPSIVEPELMLAMTYAIVGGTLLTYFLTNWALVHIESGQVAIFIYLQPLVASFSGWFILGEQIRLRTVISSIMILVGFLLVLYSTKIVKEKESQLITPT